MADASPTLGPDVGPDLAVGLRAATQRLVRTVDALPDADWSAWSLLPGWTRAHVVAHLTLNAEGLAGALEGAALGEDVPMYASDAARDDDIEALAAGPVDELRERLLGSTTRFADAWTQVVQVVEATGPDVLDREVERSPGGRRFAVGQVAAARLVEVEIHHADLATAYTCADWEPWFAAHLLHAAARRPVPPGDLVAAPVDDVRRWTFGTGAVEVTGPMHALAWWLTGRPAEGLSCTAGSLPHVARW